MKRLIAWLFVLTSPAVLADNLDSLNVLAQEDFRKLSEDLGAVASYKSLIPAEPLNFPGFDIGVEVTATELQNPSVWDLASTGTVSSTVYVPKVHLHLGLPLSFDIGAFYSTVPDTNIDFWGAELRYAILKGSTAMPALGVRATYTKVSGVDQLGLDTAGVELTISKGIAMVTPYAGIGQVWVQSTPVGISGLQAEEFSLTKYYVGANINFTIINIALEGDKTGDATSYGLKLGWRF